MRSITVLFLATLAAQAGASEQHPLDLRLTVMMAPETEKADVEYRAPTLGQGFGTSTDSLNPGLRVEVGMVAPLKTFSPTFALVGGAWFFYSNQESSEFQPGDRELPFMTGPMSYTTLGIDGFVGMAVHFDGHFELEFGPFIGLGNAAISDRALNVAGGRTEDTSHGDYEEAGLLLGLLVHSLDRSLVFGLGARYLVSYGEADLSYDLVDTTTGVTTVNGLHQHVEIRTCAFAPYVTFGLSF